MLAPGPIPAQLLIDRWQIARVLDYVGVMGGSGCEVGVNRGHHAWYILDNWPGDLWLVDGWADRPGPPGVGIDWGGQHKQNSFLEECRLRLRSFTSRTIFHRAFSPQAAASYPDGFFDFVYIDATHTYEAVRDDLAAWYPKVREGGLLCGHDYMDGLFHGKQFGVKQAVDEFALATGHSVFASIHDTPIPNWYMVSCDKQYIPPPRSSVPMG